MKEEHVKELSRLLGSSQNAGDIGATGRSWEFSFHSSTKIKKNSTENANDVFDKCIICDEGTLKPKQDKLERKFPDGTVVSLDATFYVCDRCDYRLAPNEVDEAFAQKYDQLKGLPSSEEVVSTIRNICRDTDLSLEELAVHLNWGKKTFYRWTKGSVPSRPYWDILLLLRENPEMIISSRDNGSKWLCQLGKSKSTNRVFSEQRRSSASGKNAFSTSTRSTSALFGLNS